MPRILVPLSVVLLGIFGVSTPADAQRQCRIGKPCGNTCIARDRVCRVGPGSAVWARGADTTSTRSTPGGATRPAPAVPARTVACTIDRVVDGDTVACVGGTRVRLLLIDAPELDQGIFGGYARAALERLLPRGTAARLELDLEHADRYGRTLAYIYMPDGRMANEELARDGYVVVSVYPPNVQHVDRIRAAVAEARLERRGLWSTSAFECPPAEHRRRRCD